MPSPDKPLRAADRDTLVRVRVVPRARKTGIDGLLGDEVKIRLAAPPVDGKANDALVRFIADRVGVAKSAARIERGRSARSKVVRVVGVDPATVRRALGLD